MAERDGDIGNQIEVLLGELQSGVDGERAAATGEELVRLLVEYYGAGLSRIVELLGDENPQLVHRLAADPLVESQLVLHGLHPLTVAERVEAALDRVRPYLGSHAGGVSFVGIDEDAVAHLRLSGSCHGCPSSTVTVRMTIEDAVLGAAPELTGVDVEGQTEQQPKLLQIGLRPGAVAVAPAAAPAAPVWLHPSALELPAEDAVAAVHLDGRQVLMARLNGTLFAYHDHCPSCSGSLVDGRLVDDLLTCATCGASYDVRLAGKATDGSGQHLDPLPLLDDVSGIRVALVPEAIG